MCKLVFFNLETGGEPVFNSVRAMELMNGPQGTLVKITFKRNAPTDIFECSLMRGRAQYLDLFEECQEQKKRAAMNSQVIDEGNNLVSKIREFEARINQDTTRIQTLEAENSTLSKQLKDLKVSKAPAPKADPDAKSRIEAAKTISKAQTELKLIRDEINKLML